MLNCNRTLTKISGWEMLRGEADEEFGRWRGSGRFLSLNYEELLRSPRSWASIMQMLGFPPGDACRLYTAGQKRVQQTQREMVQNWNNFSVCVHTHWPRFRPLLRPDERPRSGPLPRDDPLMCAAPQKLRQYDSNQGRVNLIQSRSYECTRLLPIKGVPRWRDKFPQYGIKVRLWGSGTLKIVIPIENHPQKTKNRLDEYLTPRWLGDVKNIGSYHKAVHVHVGVVNSRRHDSPHIRKSSL